MSSLQEMEVRLRQTRELVAHIYIHSGYKDCGFVQMTTFQRKEFLDILKKEFPETVVRLEQSLKENDLNQNLKL